MASSGPNPRPFACLHPRRGRLQKKPNRRLRAQRRKPTAADGAAEKRAAEKRTQRERAAAERSAQRTEARRREQESREAAAAERRKLQSRLEELTTERWRRLAEIKQKEETLARERRDIEQSFETRITALRKQLKRL